MYRQFFGFESLPFSITPDPKFVYYSKSHHEALAQMLYGIQERKCLMVCTGEVGAGKTTMIFTLLSHLVKGTAASMIFDTQVDPISLYKYMFSDFGIERFGENRADNAIILKQFLIDRDKEDRRSILILDEAHNLRPEIFHEVVFLSNFETQSTKLIQIILVGQPELNRILNTMEFRQLKQRINLRTAIQPLGLADTQNYIRHRITAAGAKDAELFASDAMALIHSYSRGLPRMINTICDNTLLLAFSRRQKRIDSSMIQETFSGLMEIPGGEFPGPAEPEPATEPAAAPPSPEPAQPEPAPPPPPAIEVGAKRETEGPVVLEKQDIVHATLIKISDPERLPEDLPHYRLTDNARRELLPAFVSDDPAATRQYHILTTRLGAIQSSNGLKSVMVTSSIPQEGKTVTAINLGVTMAQESSAKVVVVDCDLRQPAVHKYLGLKPGAGTTEVLTGKAFLEDAIVRFEYPNLFVIPSGKKPMNPMEVMESAEMEHFLAELAKRFHFVIVDSPPVVPIADACVLAGMVDGVILVARARSTDRKVINQAIEDLSQGNILGIVLNDHQLKISKSKYHYGYTAHGREGREAQGA